MSLIKLRDNLYINAKNIDAVEFKTGEPGTARAGLFWFTVYINKKSYESTKYDNQELADAILLDFANRVSEVCK